MNKPSKFKRVLITGTTSGLGQAFFKYYYHRGIKVVAVNRRRDAVLESKYPEAQFHKIDISKFDEVHKLLVALETSGEVPELLILNAGINLADNQGRLNFDEYVEIMQTNLFGAMSFISSVGRLGWRGKTIFTMSSTSNIVPNPGHIAYEHSKVCLDRAVDSFSQSDPSNVYKTVILGPVCTNISRNFPALVGLKKKIFNVLAVEAEETVVDIAAFLERPGKRLYYTKLSCAFYYFVKLAIKIAPSIYSGNSTPKKIRTQAATPIRNH